MTNQPTRAVGIPWYAVEDYPRIKAMMEDGHLLPQVHADWLRKAEQLESQARRQGQLVVRAHLRPDEFSGWRAARGLHINAQARTQFAASIAAEEHGRTH